MVGVNVFKILICNILNNTIDFTYTAYLGYFTPFFQLYFHQKMKEVI